MSCFPIVFIVSYGNRSVCHCSCFQVDVIMYVHTLNTGTNIIYGLPITSTGPTIFSPIEGSIPKVGKFQGVHSS